MSSAGQAEQRFEHFDCAADHSEACESPTCSDIFISAPEQHHARFMQESLLSQPSVLAEQDPAGHHESSAGNITCTIHEGFGGSKVGVDFDDIPLDVAFIVAFVSTSEM